MKVFVLAVCGLTCLIITVSLPTFSLIGAGLTLVFTTLALKGASDA